MVPDLSVSIVTYDLNLPLLTRCIASLRVAVERAVDLGRLNAWQLTIIDNGNNRRQLEAITAGEFTLISNTGNPGYGTAHNQAILYAKSRFHLILNPDVELDPGSVSLAIGQLGSDPDIAMIGPAGVDATGEPAYLAKRCPSLGVLLLRGFAPEWIARRFDSALAAYEYRDLSDQVPSEVTLLSGCCLFTNTRSLQRVRGFDESYFLYFEDFDLSMRLANVGRLVHLPTSRIVHHGGNTAAKGWRHLLWFTQSAVRFFNTWGWRLF